MKVSGIERGPPANEEEIRILQVGEGKLLRALIDPVISQMRVRGWKGLVAMTNIRENGSTNIAGMKKQGGRYNIVFRDQKEASALEINFVVPLFLDREWEKIRRISASPVLKAIITNSTEVGYQIDEETFSEIRASGTFIGIITSLLYKRFISNVNFPVTVFPTELIAGNGNLLAERIFGQLTVWNLGNEFERWIKEYVLFKNTLVDRIVTSLTDEEAVHFLEENEGYTDHYGCMAEKYGRWWIEGADRNSYTLPVYSAEEVELVDDLSGYQRMKLWILNGAHLYMACKGLSAGLKTVFEASCDSSIMDTVHSYWNDVREVIGLPNDIVDNFINETNRRFRQEWLNHQLTSIAVNIREKWKIRIGDFMEAYMKRNGFYSNAAIEITIAISEYLARSEKITVRDAIESISTDNSIVEKCMYKYGLHHSNKTDSRQQASD